MREGGEEIKRKRKKCCRQERRKWSYRKEVMAGWYGRGGRIDKGEWKQIQ
jgi:hypothetical protein